MIELNTKNGQLTIADFFISANLSAVEVESQIEKYSIQIGVINFPYKSYRVPEIMDGYIGFSTYFYNDKIDFVTISLGDRYGFPPFIVTSEERAEIDRLIRKLGGAKKYDWGSVEVADDSKGGSISVLVRYNR